MVVTTTVSEKPWYTPALVAFIRDDCPRVVGNSLRLTSRDIKTLEDRLSAEGESFITKTLPGLGKSIDVALQGHRPLLTTSFKKRRRGSALPAFLQALTRRVFSDDGWVLENACFQSIRLLRQICYWGKKIDKGYTDESLQKAAKDYIEVDCSLPACDEVLHSRLLGTAKAIVHSLFGHMPGLDRLLPAHGPGSVAGGEGVVGKREVRHKYSTLERVFRPVPFFFSLRDASECHEQITGRIDGIYGVSRIEFVNKDSSGPRTIELQPAEYMMAQQALKRLMYRHIESHKVSAGQINFTDQTINRELARQWSRVVTLDLTKASDRNSYALVRTLFEGLPIWPFLRASRTPVAVLPDDTLLFLRKFAGMGSATCFPVEAVVFFALACASMHHQGMPLGLTTRQVFVYGDDLIVPHGFFAQMQKDFESVGLEFSEPKCCVHGKFRESCGMDAFDGFDVTPVRARKIYPEGKLKFASECSTLIPVIEHANALMKAGYRSSSLTLRHEALECFPILKWALKLPVYSNSDLPILYWLDTESECVPYAEKQGQIAFVQGWVPQPRTVEGTDEGERFYFRESLSLGGPVGEIRKDPSNPGGWRRHLSLKYSSVLRYKKVPFLPGTPSKWLPDKCKTPRGIAHIYGPHEREAPVVHWWG